MMKIIAVIFFFITCPTHKGVCSVLPAFNIPSDSIPVRFSGNFTDDYGIHYTITDTLWTQHSGINYHIIKWDTIGQYLLAKNDSHNPGEANLYTRIDYMWFENMAPFYWGFCLTVYDAKTPEEAETKARANRENPKKGCGGFPFSRMKKVE